MRKKRENERGKRKRGGNRVDVSHTRSYDSSFVNPRHDPEDVPPLRFRALMLIVADTVNASKEPGDEADPWCLPRSPIRGTQ